MSMWPGHAGIAGILPRTVSRHAVPSAGSVHEQRKPRGVSERLGVLKRCIRWHCADAGSAIKRALRPLVLVFVPLASRFRRSGQGWRCKLKVRPPVGREDQSVRDQMVCNPSVLTEQICLIPGGNSVIRVEDAPGNARRIFTGIDIRGSVQDVWNVLTDYEGLAHVVPNLSQNDLVDGPDEAGGARLWQIGRASWTILGRAFFFQAGMTLDVRLHPEGLDSSKFAGAHMDASEMTSAEVRSRGEQQKLVRDIFPRPFSIAAPGVPIRDITMQNVLGEKGDFVHYQGVWRLQPLDGCAQPGEDMMRLTFAVECQPHWFLPVAPVEGRIATALGENMEAIRDHVEQSRQPMETTELSATEKADSRSESDFFGQAAEQLDLFWQGGSSNPGLPWWPSHSAYQLARPEQSSGNLFCGRRRRKRPLCRRNVLRLAASELQILQIAEAMQEALKVQETLNGAEMRLLEQDLGQAAAMDLAPAGAAADGALSSFGALTTSVPEITSAVATAVEAAVGLEAETVLTASAVAAIAAIAARSNAGQGDARAPSQLVDDDEDEKDPLQIAWRAILKQHPEAVANKDFLGTPFSYEDVKHRWPRLVQTLGISEEQALKVIEQDATPLLVDSEAAAEVLARLATISSREKALELVGKSPALLAGGVVGPKEKGLALSTLVDVLYAGRLLQVLEEDRDDEGKLAEIETYALILSAFRPFVDMLLSGFTARDASDATRRLFRNLEANAPNESVRVLLQGVASAPDPWAYLADQTKAGLSMAGSLALQPSLTQKILPHSYPIMYHLPSIYTRLSILGPHVPSIVRILDQYFDMVEPYLDRIMARMDRIEPHLPYILLHLDVLAPHCGPLLDHFDLLIPYAELGRERHNVDDCFKGGEGMAELKEVEACVVQTWEQQAPGILANEDNTYLPKLLPYVDFLVPRLDVLAPHLPLAHPHIPYVLPYMDDLLPYICRFTSFPNASRNADVLIGYLGWLLKVPILPRILYLPLVPRLIALLSSILPRRLVRGRLERIKRRHEEIEQGIDVSTGRLVQ